MKKEKITCYGCGEKVDIEKTAQVFNPANTNERIGDVCEKCQKSPHAWGGEKIKNNNNFYGRK